MNTMYASKRERRAMLIRIEAEAKALCDELYVASPSRRREIEAELLANEEVMNQLLDSLYGGAA